MHILFSYSSDASLVHTAKMNPVKMVEHVLTVWTVLFVNVIQVFGEKGKWFLLRFMSVPFYNVIFISKNNRASLIHTMLLQNLIILIAFL
jgi:hypothetical protein